MFIFQPAEKQLAATTTELAGTGSPLRFLPVLGVLLSIVLLGWDSMQNLLIISNLVFERVICRGHGHGVLSWHFWPH